MIVCFNIIPIVFTANNNVTNINTIICLLSETEFVEYGVPDLKQAYKEAGLEVHYLKIMDQSVPTTEKMDEALQWLDNLLSKKKKTLIHCVGGIGRTGTLVACYLKKYDGFSTREAMEAVRKSRSPRAIENELQEKFVNNYN